MISYCEILNFLNFKINKLHIFYQNYYKHVGGLGRPASLHAVFKGPSGNN